MKELRHSLKRLIMGNLVVALILGSMPVPVFGAEINEKNISETGIITQEPEGILVDQDELSEVFTGNDLNAELSEDITEQDDGLSETIMMDETDVLTADITSDVVLPEGGSEPKSTDSLPTTAGSYVLSQNITINETWVVSQNITLDLNGHTIDRGLTELTPDGSVIMIVSAGNLTIKDTSTDESGAITGGYNYQGGGVYVEEGGRFDLCGGTINNNNSQFSGGGVYVNKGTFNMTGGTINNNNSQRSGGGVYVYEGTFNMTGDAKIIGNKTLAEGSYGGGVYVNNGTFTMTGGTINNNNSQSAGGGVCVDFGPFHLGGDARIIGNKANAEESFGGGVYVGDGIFTMSGNSAITGNEANCGGGIDVESSTQMSMTDNARVEGNRATGEHQLGAGVRVHHSTFEMSGNAMISNNETDYYGGGLHVEGSEVNMTGGTITGNKAGTSGGVHVTAESKFMMTGGTISGNTADNSGGGLCVNKSLLTMADGSVKDNIGRGGVGGVKVNNGSFILKGGSIENNKGTYGGGIRLEESTLNMSGAEIKGNEATVGGGGGIYAGNDSVLTVSGGSVRGNSSRNYWSGGVYYANGAVLNVSGNPYIYDNFKGGTLSSDGLYKDGIHADINTGNESEGFKVITVTGAMTDGAKVGICGVGGVAVAEGGNGYDIKETDAKGFVSDYDEGSRTWDVALDNGKLYMGFPLSTCSINDIPDQIYTGSPIKPAVKVTDGQTVLVNDGQYIVDYENNIESGTAKIIITGKHRDESNSKLASYVGKLEKEFVIKKADFAEQSVTGEAKAGGSGMLVLKDYLAEGGTYADPTTGDPDSVLSGNVIFDKVEKTLSWKFKSNEEILGKSATVSINVTGVKNYNDYVLTVTLKPNGCSHPEGYRVRRGVKAATCDKEGYTGDLCCAICGAVMEPGSPKAKDPNNHVYEDGSDAYGNGVVVKEATSSQSGRKEFECKLCHHKRSEIIPSTGSKDDYTDLNKDVKDVSGNNISITDDGKGKETVKIGDKDVSVVSRNASGKETVDTKIWVGGLKDSYTYTGAAIKPEFRVYDGTKKLIAGKDYSVGYSSNKAVCESKAMITIKFKGSYAGTEQKIINFSIVKASLADDVEVSDISIIAPSKEQKPVPTIIMKSTGKKISKNNFKFSYKDAYSKDVTGVKEAGTYKVIIEPKEGSESFTGYAKAEITVTDKTHLLSKATVKLNTGKPSKFTYTGAELPKVSDRAGRYTLSIKDGSQTVTLSENRDYSVTYSDNINPGTAKVTFTGIGKYAGTKTATFKIVKGRSLNEKDITFSCDGSVPYAKNGAKPVVTVKDGDTELTLGKDYTVSYKNNRAVASIGATKNGKDVSPLVIVKGKGIYKGTKEIKFNIEKQSINRLKIVVDDKVESRKGYKNPTVTITDLDGKKLNAKTDFEIGTDYSEPDKETKVVTVTIKGNGNYTGDKKVSYRYITAGMQLGKAGVMNKIADQIYTGREIKLDGTDLTNVLFTGKKSSPTYLKLGTDFEILSYTNNENKGTAKVTLKGIGKYGGTKTLTFKIKAKQGTYLGAIKDGGWK